MTPPVADPARAENLANRYEPDLMLEKRDQFWPVAVRTIDLLRAGSRRTCLADEVGAPCRPAYIRELPWASGSDLAYLNYPADGSDPGAERAGVAAALKSGAPGTDARMYYYVTGRDPDRPVTLQYWFYYPFNYLEAHSPFGLASINTDMHEGDIEGMSVLLSAKQRLPVYAGCRATATRASASPGTRARCSEMGLTRSDMRRKVATPPMNHAGASPAAPTSTG